MEYMGRKVLRIICEPSIEDKRKVMEDIAKAGRRRRKKVWCLSTGKVFNSLTEASEEMKLDKGNLSKACNGKRESVDGFIFSYI